MSLSYLPVRDPRELADIKKLIESMLITEGYKAEIIVHPGSFSRPSMTLRKIEAVDPEC